MQKQWKQGLRTGTHSSAGLMALKNTGAKTQEKNLNQMLGNFYGVSYKTNRAQRVQINQTICKKHLHFIKYHSKIRHRFDKLTKV